MVVVVVVVVVVGIVVVVGSEVVVVVVGVAPHSVHGEYVLSLTPVLTCNTPPEQSHMYTNVPPILMFVPHAFMMHEDVPGWQAEHTVEGGVVVVVDVVDVVVVVVVGSEVVVVLGVVEVVVVIACKVVVVVLVMWVKLNLHKSL